MFADIFKGGKLELPLTADDAIQASAGWADCTVNKILVGVAVLLMVLTLADYFNLLPILIRSLTRKKTHLDIEHSISTARQRNLCALAFVLPYCLIADRYRLFNPSFCAIAAPELQVAVTIGAFILFILFKRIVFFLVHPRVDQQTADTVRNLDSNYFILLASTALASVVIFLTFRLSDNTCKIVLLWETAFFFLLSMLRAGRFLGQRCSWFSTILYLCALEIAPAALLVAAAVLL